jgi:hypothetical protein
LLRGRYHEHVAAESNLQILAHPTRGRVSLRTRSNESATIALTNTEKYLANIALAGAFSERSHESHTALWAENVTVLRRARGQINLGVQPLEEVALNVAVDAAHKYDVRCHDRQLEEALDLGAKLTVPFLTFALNPWAGLAVGVAEVFLSSRIKAGPALAKAFSARSSNLKRLSQMSPGRLTRSVDPK